jgi:CRP-like cAMP-binding protein
MYSFKDEVRTLGSFLTVEGEVGETIYMLLSGEVSVFKILEGKQYLIGILSEKSIIGEELILFDPTDTTILTSYSFSY